MSGDYLLREKVIQWTNENAFNKNGNLNSNLTKILNKEKNKNILECVILYTNFLKLSVSISERIYCLTNNIYKEKKCKICNNEIKFYNYKKGYAKFCSVKCACKSKEGDNNPAKRKDVREKISDTQKGKTWEMKYGKEKANQMKENLLKISLSRWENGVYHSQEAIKKMSNARKGKTWEEIYGEIQSNRMKENLSKIKTGTKLTSYHKNKISESSKGKIHSENAIKNMRISTIKRIEEHNGIAVPNYNIKAYKFFNWFDEQNNTVGIYANNPFEYMINGYFLDYINFELKLIIEWDEEHHYKDDQLSEKDIKRQKEIQNCLPSFKFVRIRENEFNQNDYTNII